MEQQKLRQGFTTGSCAAAAAKAAIYMLLTGKEKYTVDILTPKEIRYHAKIEAITRSGETVSCGVRKDGGDDPDVTSGSLICARVSFDEYEEGVERDSEVVIDGGEGVGRVTKPGLDQPVGAAAINHVPREMITREVLDVCDSLDRRGIIRVIIYVPGGADLARKTFNGKLGIEGGISIIGTTGIVEPMSTKAILDTIFLELKQRRALGYTYVVVAPGNYGQAFIKERYGYEPERSVKCSNFIGDALSMAEELGMQELLLVGHIGKLSKVGGGMRNTHSKYGDCRMETIASCAEEVLTKHAGHKEDSQIQEHIRDAILACISTEEALRVLEQHGILAETMQVLFGRIKENLRACVKGTMQVSCILYSSDYGELERDCQVERFFRDEVKDKDNAARQDEENAAR